MRKVLLPALLLASAFTAGFAQRTTDLLDRGLVAVPAKTGGGNLVSWRLFAEEYYDVTYNLYCNGSLIAKGLKSSNYSHTAGTSTSKYKVAAVVNGEEQEQSAEVSRWNAGYKQINVASVTDRDGNTVTSSYIINDVSLGDVDGDGVTEFLMKRNYTGGVGTLTNKTCFHHYECYNMAGERLWWIDMGPNMLAGPDEQWDMIAYDWDQDGKAEVLLRGADNMIIHMADGTTMQVGSTADTRWEGVEYTNSGNEYLLYLEGSTGKPYNISGDESKPWMTYPLPRGSASDWGDSYGHRSTKHYFGAPFLDGRTASIFLGRGCYTQHHFKTFDVDPATHALTLRWEWKGTSGAYYGQGYHNYGIADVDEDGRDEIVFGSMVIDDNGQGLSTAGLGHGDAQHCGDFDPYRKGLEFFACNESSPNMNYRNATTSKLYYRSAGTSDDGRGLCGNFSNDFPGCLARSVNTGLISTVADREVVGGPSTAGTNDGLYWSHLNFRIYWTGDLLEGILDSPGTEREAVVWTTGGGRVFQSEGCAMNNDSKNNPSASGDIIGDWREEIVVRTSDNASIRIYTTPFATSYRIPTLWHDHQYRQAMVWQCIGYNQPPHTSFFLGQLEGITVAPPPYTMTGRVEVADGGTISSAHNGQHVIVCETNNSSVTVADGAAPSVTTFNVPSWVQGTNSSNTAGNGLINYEYYTCQVNGAAFTGNMRLVKQGDGILNLPAVENTHTGNTDIWAGTLNFNGSIKNSSLWLNRFTTLNSDGGSFRSIRMDYASTLRPGGEDKKGTVTVDTLKLGFGARVQFDIYSDGILSDLLKTKVLDVEIKTGSAWETYGPAYITPVVEFVTHCAEGATEIAAGNYLLAEGIETVNGNLSDIKIEGLGTSLKTKLMLEGDKLYLVVSGVRDAASIIWNGEGSSIWDFASSPNFTSATDATVTDEIFVSGDKVSFTDVASSFNISLNGELEADTVIVDASKAYTFSGTGSLIGNTTLVKRGSGVLTITNDNTYTGGTRISGGTVKVTSLSHATQAYGNLGGVNTAAAKFVIENGAMLSTTATVQMGSPVKFETAEGGIINNTADFIVNRSFSGTKAIKQGSGWMKLNVSNSTLDTMVINAGTVQCISSTVPAKTIVYSGGALLENAGTSYNIHVPTGKTGAWTTANRCTYTNKITGDGTLTIYCATEKGSNYYATRTPLQMNMSAFTGTIIPQATYAADGRFTLDTNTGLPKGTMNIPSGIIVQNSGKVYTIGQVTGKGSLGGGCTFSNGTSVGANTWRVGNDEDFTWEGAITGESTNFTKIGSGKMTMKGVSDCTGAIRVDEGTLFIATSTVLGTGSFLVGEKGMLSGVTGTKGSLTNSRYTINGVVEVGMLETSFSGQINFGGKNVTFNSGSVYKVRMRSCATKSSTGGTSIQQIANLTMNGTIQVRLHDDYVPVEGDSLVLWKEVETFTGTPKFELPELSGGYYWITDRVAEGVLSIGYDPTGIETITADEEVTVTVVSTGGVEVAVFTCPMGAVEETFQKLSVDRGIYLLHVKSSETTGVLKLMKR